MVLSLTYRNPHIWKDRLYIETGPGHQQAWYWPNASDHFVCSIRGVIKRSPGVQLTNKRVSEMRAPLAVQRGSRANCIVACWHISNIPPMISSFSWSQICYKFDTPYFIQQQHLWHIAIQPTVGCSAYKLIYVVRLLTARGESSGAHFTNNFSITIQMWWKFHFALIQILIKWSLQYLAHGTTAGLSWHVLNFVAIWSSVIELELNEISIEFELWWKNS